MNKTIKKLHALKISLIIFGYDINVLPTVIETNNFLQHDVEPDSNTYQKTDTHIESLEHRIRKNQRDKHAEQSMEMETEGLTDEDRQISFFVHKIQNFLKNDDKKNREMWFSQEAVITDPSTPKALSDLASDKTVARKSSFGFGASSLATSREMDTTRAKEDILMIEHSKISVNYVRQPSRQRIATEF